MAAEIKGGYSSTVRPAANGEDAARLRLIDELTANADKVQEEVLKGILSVNSETEYLRRFGLEGATDRKAFESKVPVVDYDDVKPYVQRVANGDRSAVLTAHPISEFITSSGTSGGERKLTPMTNEEMDRRCLYMDLVVAVTNTCAGESAKGKGLYFLLVRSETRTPGGLPASSALTSYYKSDHFLSTLHAITSPKEAILCPDHFQSMYVQMMSGLYQREHVLRMGAPFASGLLRAIRFLQLHYQDLARDISAGALTSKITDPSVRASVSHLLKPDPNLAELILKECSAESWEGIVRRIWPETRLLDVIVTGTMAQYVPTLDHYSGGLPLVSTIYGCSECCTGINLTSTCKPSEVSYTILPNMAYFEFIPLEPPDDGDRRRVVGLTEVVVGKEYEVVVTNHAGLYRYRVGDVLRAVGFHNASPRFHFVRRENALLSIDTERIDEAELQRGVDSASRLLAVHGTRVVEYTSSADTKTIPGHYVVYLELSSKDPSGWPSEEVMERCCLAIEEELNAVYRQNRVESGSIGALEIRVTKEGTFEELMEYAVSKGASVGQYKVPRCVNVVPIVELLDSGVESSHFSRRLPTWTRPANQCM